MSAVSKEILDQWVITGFDEKAVAGYGTSVENLIKLTRTGQIPWSLPNPQVEMLPYQRRLLAGGGYLYFACPFLEHTKGYLPDLSEEIKHDLVVQYSPSDMIKTCQFYARRRARIDYFEQEIGVYYEDGSHILIMAGVLFPRDFRRFIRGPEIRSFDYKSFFLSEDRNFRGLETLQISLPKLRRVLQECLKRRGVVIYFNEGIFQHKIVKGVEAEDEILIVSKEPLTADVVAGVQLFSNADKRALRNWIRQ